ncbi:MAG: hypothetical protein Q8P07_02305 [bacterium]|nr:hypothetical protein [bacterium]
MWDSFMFAEKSAANRAGNPAEVDLGEGSRLKIVQGNTCVILEPKVKSVCWDSLNKGETISVVFLSDVELKRLFHKGVSVIFNKDQSEIVGIEIT